MNFAMEALISLLCCSEKVLINMNTWIAEKDSMKNYCTIKKLFIVV